MKNKIKYFKTGEEISNDFYTLLANVNFCCNHELDLVENERADASYHYHIWCPKCRKTICKINWDGKITNNVC